MDFNLLKEICQLNGTSGDELSVANYIKNKLENEKDIQINTDNLGNLIVFKKGEQSPKNKVMLAAHMDEVGFIVTYITDDGYLKFDSVGGIDTKVIIGRQLILSNGTVGIIGTKAGHQKSAAEKEKSPSYSDLFIDIGAISKEVAQKYVKLGDRFHFKSEFIQFGDGFIKGKAIDDRAGCAILLDLIEKNTKYDCSYVFTTQEEIGTRGAQTATYNVQPNFAIVVESTTACDFPNISEEKQVCKLGEGAVVSYMDRSAIYDNELYNLTFETAQKNGIKVQTKTMVAGGNDSGAIHKSIGGVRTIAISIPCRNLHSSSCVIKNDDYTSVNALALEMLYQLCEI